MIKLNAETAPWIQNLEWFNENIYFADAQRPILQANDQHLSNF